MPAFGFRSVSSWLNWIVALGGRSDEGMILSRSGGTTASFTGLSEAAISMPVRGVDGILLLDVLLGPRRRGLGHRRHHAQILDVRRGRHLAHALEAGDAKKQDEGEPAADQDADGLLGQVGAEALGSGNG